MGDSAIKGLNLEAIRELNKIHVYAVKDKVTGGVTDETTGRKVSSFMEEIFSAYLTSPVGSFDVTITDGSLTKQAGDFISKSEIATTIAETAVGSILKSEENQPWLNFLGSGVELSNQLNYNFNYRFTGINEFKKTFQCELVMKDDLFEDVIDPLWKLLDYVLPDETQQLHETDLYGQGRDFVRKTYNTFKSSIKDATNDLIDQDILDKFWNYVEGLGGTADSMLGGLSFMHKPKQLQSGNLFTRILIGNYIIIDNVIVETVGFNIPNLLYEGGLFDKVTVTLGIKGNRKMSLKNYDWLRQLSSVGNPGTEFTTADGQRKKTRQATLNALYNSDNKRFYSDGKLKPKEGKVSL